MKGVAISLSLVFIFILLSSSVIGVAGVSPAIYEVDFQPGLRQSYRFNFFSDEGVKAEIYAEGDLAQYTKLDKKEIRGSEPVIATIELPNEIYPPGEHKLLIGARQVVEEEGGIGLVGNIRGVIKIKVPYPGKYVEIDFKTHNANAGEPVEFRVSARNLGKENINALAYLDITTPQKEKLDTIFLGAMPIETTKSGEFYKKINTTGYRPGDYNVSAIVKYGGDRDAFKEGIFRLGELYAAIGSTSNDFEKNKINRFNIGVESFWNDPIDGLYADVKIIGTEISFLTPSVNLPPWEKTTLVGFLDTTLIQNETFQANITLHYYDKTTSKIVDLRFKKEKPNYMVITAIIAAVMIIILLIVIIIILIRYKRKISLSSQNTGKNLAGRRK
jgi:hypothetical protein